MTPSKIVLVTLGVFAVLGLPAHAQDWSGLSDHEWYQEVTLPRAEPGRLVSIVLPLTVCDKARPDLSDLRLFDRRGTAVPYALRVRRTVDQRAVTPVRR
jgi:hypothetical protein